MHEFSSFFFFSFCYSLRSNANFALALPSAGKTSMWPWTQKNVKRTFKLSQFGLSEALSNRLVSLPVMSLLLHRIKNLPAL